MRTKSFAKTIEGIGLLLVLLAFLWEFDSLRWFESNAQEAEFGLLHSKLDQIHHRQYMLKEHIDFKISQLELKQPAFGMPIGKDWNPTTDGEAIKTFKTQGNVAKGIKAIIFILGSLCIVGSKFLEATALRREEQEKKAAQAGTPKNA